jgi:hypothetical protein
MRPDLDLSSLTPDQCRREVAALLAAGLRRLRDRHALGPVSDPEIPAKTEEKRLDAAPETRLSVPVG